MELHTTVFDRALHLALFVAALAAIALAALAVLERVTDGRRTIRLRHVAIPMAVFAAIGVTERLYHLLT